MTDSPIPKMAYENVNTRFNISRQRASQYTREIQTFIDQQADWFPEFNGYPFRGEAKRLTEMQELEEALRSVRDRFCHFDDTW